MAATLIASVRILGSIRLAFGIIGLTANIFQVIYSVIKKKYATNFEKSLMSLSFADILTSITLIFLASVELKFDISLFLCINIFLNLSITTMFNHTILIAAQRLIAVVYPLKVKIILSKRRFHVLLALTWISACVYGIGIVFVMKHFVRLDSYIILVSGIILIISYAAMSYTTYRKEKDSSNLTSHREERGRSRAVLLHSFLVTIAFVTCFFPFAINVLFFNSLKPIFVLFESLLSINPLLDSLIYFYMKYCRGRQEPTMELNAQEQLRRIGALRAKPPEKHLDTTRI